MEVQRGGGVGVAEGEGEVEGAAWFAAMSGGKVELRGGQWFYVAQCGAGVEGAPCRLVGPEHRTLCKTRFGLLSALDDRGDFRVVRLPVGCECLQVTMRITEDSEARRIRARGQSDWSRAERKASSKNIPAFESD